MAQALPRRSLSRARPLADLVGPALAPACRKRGFASADLVASWRDIVGPAYARSTQPEKLSFPRRGEEAAPATLTIRCMGAAALRLQHDMPVLIERINVFFGYPAVGRVRIVQGPLAESGRHRRPHLAPLGAEEEARLAGSLGTIEDDGLRAAMLRLGRAVRAQRLTPSS